MTGTHTHKQLALSHCNQISGILEGQVAPSYKVITWQSRGHIICYDDGANFHNLGWARVERQQQP